MENIMNMVKGNKMIQLALVGAVAIATIGGLSTFASADDKGDSVVATSTVDTDNGNTGAKGDTAGYSETKEVQIDGTKEGTTNFDGGSVTVSIVE
ncbi:MAG: hypothetical protein LBM95_05285 [Lactobacillales bacterium]|jgi:hypothetical protein|nr:hypothetical protein [Lactobacillales bacterium]